MLFTRSSSPLVMESITCSGHIILLNAHSPATSSPCPECGVSSSQIHDHYQRQPLDLPWRGYPVRLALKVWRFRCRNRDCPRATFAEDFGAILPKWPHRTTAATQALLQLAITSGGEAGARLARQLGLPTSPDTLLRLLRQASLPCTLTPRVLGVDDLSLRKGHSYATILVDLETHRPVELLRARTANTVATWLKEHPGVEIAVRDRSEAYAEGIRGRAPGDPGGRPLPPEPERQHRPDRGAPGPQAAGGILRGGGPGNKAGSPQATIPPREDPTAGDLHLLSPSQQRLLARRTARRSRWQEVHRLHDLAWSLGRIAEAVGVHRRTVRRLLDRGEPPRNRVLRPRPSGIYSPLLQPYVSYLQHRWQQGCTNASQLFRELVGLGYPGSRTLLADAVRPWRPPPEQPVVTRHKRRVSVRKLCLRPPEGLSPEEQQALEKLLAEDPELATGYGLLQGFRQLLFTRDVAALERWIGEAQASGLPPFVALANGLRADQAAVEAALSTPWSNGPVEGHIHRVKLIKRQGYGRTKLDLLRARVLAA